MTVAGLALLLKCWELLAGKLIHPLFLLPLRTELCPSEPTCALETYNLTASVRKYRDVGGIDPASSNLTAAGMVAQQ